VTGDRVGTEGGGSPAEDHLLVSVYSGVGSVTLNRPDRLNSFTAAMLVDLRATLERFAADESVRCVMLTGAGRAFCAGQDLSDRSVAPGAAPPDLGESLGERYNPVVTALRTTPKPVVVAVNGVAAGAGANLALHGDIVIAARSARFIQSFAKLGLVPDSGGTYLLPRLAGSARAMGMALLAEPVTAEQALEWGMVWAVVDDEELTSAVAALTTELAAGPTAGYARIKQAMAASLGNTLADQLELERALQQEAGRSDDYAEGVAAFMEKRPPRFGGR
jgi:2-(1,2-epoxy-1,2-dihydrophenyl)acetyl-CoA isomerase